MHGFQAELARDFARHNFLPQIPAQEDVRTVSQSPTKLAYQLGLGNTETTDLRNICDIQTSTCMDHSASFLSPVPTLCCRFLTDQGMLRGMHNLDACDPFVAIPPVEADASVAGAAGEGSVSSVGDLPPAESSYNFLAAHLEGWRRLECDEESNLGAALSGIPHGLAILSLQVPITKRPGHVLLHALPVSTRVKMLTSGVVW